MASENPPATPPGSSAAVSRGSTGFLMIGALIIVGGHLLFSLILDEFSFGILYVAISLLALLAIYGVGGADFISTRGLKWIGFFMGAAGLLLLLADIRSGFPDGVVDNLANIAFYAGCALMFLGARGLK